MEDLKQIRKKISEFDLKILKLAKERSGYLLNKGFYKPENNKELWQDSALLHYIKIKYLPIISHICKEGNDKKQWEYLMKVDKPLIYNIINRCGLGVDIVKCKDPLGLPIYVPETEAKKIKELKECGRKIGLEGKAVEGMFKAIMDETKRIENYISETNIASNVSLSPVQEYKAGTKNAKEIMIQQAEDEIKKLKKEQRGKYSLKVSQRENIWVIGIYRV
ncbi:MAG: chorismate mutase [Nanoarchaeota archaeon]|nr:chorismate mutase [Nanoarchaeota archaeon]